MSNTIIEKNGNFACGIFVDPQRSFDTMDHIMIYIEKPIANQSNTSNDKA